MKKEKYPKVWYPTTPSWRKTRIEVSQDNFLTLGFWTVIYIHRSFFQLFVWKQKKTGAETFSFSGEGETKQLCVGEERRAFLFLLLSTSQRKIEVFFERKILTLGGKHNTSLFYSSVFFVKGITVHVIYLGTTLDLDFWWKVSFRNGSNIWYRLTLKGWVG